MHALVVVESFWGHTSTIGRAIADGLAASAVRVAVVETDAAPGRLPPDLDLLVVGGPTHAFSMSTPETRRTAAERGAPTVPERGIREWIKAVERPPTRIPVAVFDTRTRTPEFPGSAATLATRRLSRRGFDPIAEPMTFWVRELDGPLLDGERYRAREWGRDLTVALLHTL
ncbi:hypothetical protein FLP10_07275 [Agromyces intestinalis]|uniref:Flavodoxin-like domain-containing protein n=1 Tax=Agromyces intestinalis TaxID=2592652 RepID=A0A5C1YGM7_9MICO|nr:hypothetical protein [Agromyces intestinalis]QEO14239.1 hypothetical protein FLP10_07275 [Agromyces intestinalis]